MKNYLCINGKKTELTEEQMRQLGILKEPIAVLSEDGETAKIGEYEFIVLEQHAGRVALLLKNTLCDGKFDNKCNNFAESDIREYLDEFADKLADLVGEDNIVEHTVDLTSDDGLKCYGSCDCRVSLLTTQMYRDNVYTIDKYKVDKWWWLATAYSTSKHGDTTCVKCASPSGNMTYGLVNYNRLGVRPFLIFVSSISVSCEE